MSCCFNGVLEWLCHNLFPFSFECWFQFCRIRCCFLLLAVHLLYSFYCAFDVFRLFLCEACFYIRIRFNSVLDFWDFNLLELQWFGSYGSFISSLCHELTECCVVRTEDIVETRFVSHFVSSMGKYPAYVIEVHLPFSSLPSSEMPLHGWCYLYRWLDYPFLSIAKGHLVRSVLTVVVMHK